ncbi:ABC transporter permease [Companilactobacillus baiquanensis]|uniref:ABC transporter permease n=1 Tax=Companilactobacillus baiquanensis TaxID=2486005 RepID=A0ABW1UY41_9LACO|nr:ABC transporter permease [Companilactobacillus baiquanensis]
MRTKIKFSSVVGFLVLVILVVPLLIVIITSFGEESAISFPIKGFTFDWYANVFQQPDFVEGLKMSSIVAIVASFLALVVGTPMVYVLTRFDIHHKDWFQTIFLSPALIPEIVIGFALYQALVISLQLPLFISLLVGHFLLCLPYVVRLITAGMMEFDESIEEAAWMVGYNKLSAFFKVVIPNIKQSVVAAFILSFITSFNNIPISLFLNGPDLNMLPTSILNYLENNYDPTVSAVSVILMIITASIMIIAEKYLGLNKLT